MWRWPWGGTIRKAAGILGEPASHMERLLPKRGPVCIGIFPGNSSEFLTHVLMVRNLAYFIFVEIDAQEVKQ